MSYPQIRLPGSDTYWQAYQWGDVLDKAFPGQDAHDFAYAIRENDTGPLEKEDRSIVGLLLVQQGDNEGPDWIWLISLDDDTYWWLRGGCDYTGWDCGSFVEWAPFEHPMTLDDICSDIQSWLGEAA